jgi:cytochrome c553
LGIINMKRKLSTTLIAVILGLAGSTGTAKASEAEDKTAVCAGCHGPGGQSEVPANPILAGQQARYLAGALQAYLSGARENSIMKTMAERLSAQDIEDIAAYYAAQPRKQSQARATGDAAAGESKVAICAGCHGTGGHSEIPENPSLAGQHAVYLAKALQAYKAGERNNPVMSPMVSALSTQDIEDIAAYYAAQPAEPQSVAAAPSAAEPGADSPEARAAVCAGCHGAGGHSAVPDNPILAGQHADYLVIALKAYANGGRVHGIMKTMAERLSARDIEAIAAYYGKQTPGQSEAQVSGDAAAGADKTATCIGCHGPEGHSAIPVNPRLAGQHAVYLGKALRAYRSGGRSSTVMQAMVASLSEQDIEDIAAYYATQSPTPGAESGATATPEAAAGEAISTGPKTGPKDAGALPR